MCDQVEFSGLFSIIFISSRSLGCALSPVEWPGRSSGTNAPWRSAHPSAGYSHLSPTSSDTSKGTRSRFNTHKTGRNKGVLAPLLHLLHFLLSTHARLGGAQQLSSGNSQRLSLRVGSFLNSRRVIRSVLALDYFKGAWFQQSVISRIYSQNRLGLSFPWIKVGIFGQCRPNAGVQIWKKRL